MAKPKIYVASLELQYLFDNQLMFNCLLTLTVQSIIYIYIYI